jgi:hypothetical protein
MPEGEPALRGQRYTPEVRNRIGLFFDQLRAGDPLDPESPEFQALAEQDPEAAEAALAQDAERQAAVAARQELPPEEPSAVDLSALVDMAETPAEEPTADPSADTATDPLAGAADSVLPGIRETFGVGEPDRAPRNRRERIEQELQLIKDVFGDKTKDESRERAMNLAMIGLAIAAGQSPNAITNIAQGALAGTQAMQRAQAAAAEREDALRMQAFDNVMAEEREERGFQRQMQLAQFKAGLGGEGSAFTKPTHPMNQWFTTRNRLEQDAGDPSKALWEQTQGMSEEERRQLLDTMALETVMTGVGETPETQQLAESVRSGQAGQAFSQSFGGPPVVTSQAEYDSLPSGAMFMQNGQLRRKP